MAIGGDRRPPGGPVRLGLRANWPQFALLVVVNVFVGGMVGLERATTSLVGTRVFHLSGYLAVFSFIVAFGVTKALANLAAGPLTARHARKTLLVAGWAAGLPVPFLLAWAPAWAWIVAANVCLGVNQGLTSSMVVNMKMDLVGPRGRGLAMGIGALTAAVMKLPLTSVLLASLLLLSDATKVMPLVIVAVVVAYVAVARIEPRLAGRLPGGEKTDSGAHADTALA